MRNNGKGGMCTSHPQASIICPLCSKSAAKRTDDGVNIAYLHYTKAGHVLHILTPNGWVKKRKIYA